MAFNESRRHDGFELCSVLLSELEISTGRYQARGNVSPSAKKVTVRSSHTTLSTIEPNNPQCRVYHALDNWDIISTTLNRSSCELPLGDQYGYRQKRED